jgi:predicted ribosomally synthesized peptide with nif11-like leader
MSIELAKEFLVRVATDESLAPQADEAQRAALLGLAKKVGYSFSDADLNAAMGQIDELDELTAADLQHVAGGLLRRRILDS